MNAVLPFSFHVQISAFAKGKVLDWEGSCSGKALVLHTGAHSRFWRERNTTGEECLKKYVHDTLVLKFRGQNRIECECILGDEIKFAY